MKTCINCHTQQPDNFIACAHCGAALPTQPTGGLPMQMFMYDRSLINKNGSQSVTRIVIMTLAFSFGIALLVAVSAVIPILFDSSEEFTLVISVLFAVGVVAAAIAFGLYMKSKSAKSNIAYIYYNGILYRIIMRTPIYALFGNFGLTAGALYALDKKSKYADEFLKLFARYTAGEKLRDSMTGGSAHIEPLNGFRVTGESTKYYHYNYIQQNGSIKAEKMDKAYPGIEAIFNFCR